jgi:uncharacterized protein with von Willebrand factor type A (vWA) domain
MANDFSRFYACLVKALQESKNGKVVFPFEKAAGEAIIMNYLTA